MNLLSKRSIFLLMVNTLEPRVRRAGPRSGLRIQTVVRLHPEVDRQVRALATAERRSLGAQLEILVERGLRSYSPTEAVA